MLLARCEGYAWRSGYSWQMRSYTPIPIDAIRRYSYEMNVGVIFISFFVLNGF